METEINSRHRSHSSWKQGLTADTSWAHHGNRDELQTPVAFIMETDKLQTPVAFIMETDKLQTPVGLIMETKMNSRHRSHSSWKQINSRHRSHSSWKQIPDTGWVHHGNKYQIPAELSWKQYNQDENTRKKESFSGWRKISDFYEN
ncbi:hypothetical protein BsWGS_18639 [Bradybaena similaris]